MVFLYAFLIKEWKWSKSRMDKWTKTKASQAEYEIMDTYWNMERHDNAMLKKI